MWMMFGSSYAQQKALVTFANPPVSSTILVVFTNKIFIINPHYI